MSRRFLGIRAWFAVFLLANAATVGANDGVLDPTCGAFGYVVEDILGRVQNQATSAVLQPDGKVVIAGFIGGPTDDFVLARYNPDGSLDAAFGSGGLVTTDFFGRFDRALALALQTDGKIVAAGVVGHPGTQRDFGLARYNSDGSLDATFGSGGKVNTDFFGRSDSANAIAIQEDGRIVAAGAAFNPGTGANQLALARYETDGTLDAGFGAGGLVTTSVMGFDDEAFAVALQGDGKILAGGYALITGTNYDFALARFHGLDGTLDASFGAGGVVMTDFAGGDDEIFALAIQVGGKIVAGGKTLSAASGYDFALARYSPVDGSLDATFGAGGKVTTDFGGAADAINALLIRTTGQILAVGNAVPSGQNLDMALAQYDPATGNLDVSFGVNGKVTTDFSGNADSAGAVLPVAGDRILAIGFATIGANGRDWGLVRYLTDGTLDVGWGTGGKVSQDLSGSTPNEVHGVALQADGKMVVAGSTRLSGTDFVVARFNVNGALDGGFGSGGIVITDFSGGFDSAQAIAIQADGKLIAAGFALDEARSAIAFALARYNTDGTLDPGFGAGGKVMFGLRGLDDEISAIALQPDGKIVAAGTSADPSTFKYSIALARFNSDGTPDLSFGTGGFVTTTINGIDDEALAVALQADQRVVIAGKAVGAPTTFVLARYNTDGSLDAGFGTGGIVMTNIHGNDDEAFAVAIQADQRIIAGGFSVDAAPEFALARYGTDGSLDASFGTGGIVTASLFGNDDEVFALAVQPDQKIVAVGTAWMAEYKFAVARFNPDGSPDAGFGTSGTVTTVVAGFNDQVRAVALEPEGRIVVGGVAVGGQTGPDLAIARYFVCGFRDVASSNQFHEDICSVAQAGITAGCGEGNYCPDLSVTRAQMAVFLLKSEHGIDYVPPTCHGAFPDVACPSLFADWIEQLAAEGITAGCGGGNYCPSGPVTRAQMSAFLLKTEHGTSYTPPACAGIFGDVTCPSQFAAWIEALYAENITGGCQASPLLYCPTNPVTRGQMAVFLRKTFGIPLY